MEVSRQAGYLRPLEAINAQLTSEVNQLRESERKESFEVLRVCEGVWWGEGVGWWCFGNCAFSFCESWVCWWVCGVWVVFWEFGGGRPVVIRTILRFPSVFSYLDRDRSPLILNVNTNTSGLSICSRLARCIGTLRVLCALLLSFSFPQLMLGCGALGYPLVT